MPHPFAAACRYFRHFLHKLFINREKFGKMDNLHYLLHKRHNIRLSKHLPKIWNSRAHFILVQVSASGAFSVWKRLATREKLDFFRHLSSFADVNRV
jgi:hypothetical protein